MIEIFKKEIEITDTVKLYLTSGKEVVVEIVEIGDKYVLVKNHDGSQSRFFEQLIGGWDLINKKAESIIEKAKIEEIELDKESEKNITEDLYIENPSSSENSNKIIVEDEGSNSIQENEGKEYFQKRIGLKIVGKIDLNQIDPRRNKKKVNSIPQEKRSLQNDILKTEPKTLSEHIQQHNLVFKSFYNLNELKEKIKFDNANKIVPANATIKRYGQNSHGTKFGFVTDNNLNDYYFSLSDIYDEELKDLLFDNKFEGIQVVCVFKTQQGRPRATSIYLPKTIQEFQDIAENHFHKKEFIECQYLLNFILNTVDDFEESLELKNKISYELSKKKITAENSNSIYVSAKKELRKGNNDYAKKLLIELIETPNSKSESALKELSYELQREGKLDEAIELVLKNQTLIKTSDPNSLLAYFYETKKDYFTAISFLEKIKPKTPIERLRVDKRLAIDFFQTKDYIS